MIKKDTPFFFFICIVAWMNPLYSQQIVTLEKCREMAVREHSMQQQEELYASAAEAKVAYLKKIIRPQASAFGVFSYQSDVPDPNSALEFGFDFVPLSKDQYRTGVYVKQQLYDGGEFRNKKEMILLEHEIEKNNLFKERLLIENYVDDLFFNIVFLLKSRAVINSQTKFLNERLEHINVLFENGKVLATEVLNMELALQELEGKTIQLDANDLRLRNTLSVITGTDISADDSIVIPSLGNGSVVKDPFFRSIDLERQGIILSEKISLAAARPKAYIFGIGGYARPALDLFNNSPEMYGVAGFSLVIPITAWRDHKNYRRILSFKDESLVYYSRRAEVKRKSAIADAQGKIEELAGVLVNDRLLVEKHEQITRSCVDLYDLGEISFAFVTEAITNETNARIELERHAIELLRAKIRKERIVTELSLNMGDTWDGL